VPGVGKRVIGAEPDTRTPLSATGMMHTTPVYVQHSQHSFTHLLQHERLHGSQQNVVKSQEEFLVNFKTF